MNKLIFASSESCADLWYLTGFAASDPFLFFQTDRLAAVAVNSIEIGRAQKQCRPGIQVADAGHLAEFFQREPVSDSKLHWFVRQIRTLCEGTGVYEWNVPNDFPVAYADLLRENGIKVTPLWPFAPERKVKTAEEIEKIRHSEQLAEAGLAEADGMLRQATVDSDGYLVLGGTRLYAEELRGAINAAIARKGGVALGTIAAPGLQGSDPHQSGMGPVRANEPIVMDIFPRDQNTGYFGDLTRTRVKGKASPIVRKAYETVLDAQLEVLRSLKAGVLGCDMQKLVTDKCDAAGFPTGRDLKTGIYHGFFHSLGHSVGMEIHEGPNLSPAKEAPLVSGHVVTVEPGLYDPAWGGIRIEDTVAITETGIDNLATVGKELEI
ncbi:MAG: M24 family metallopeptidase [Lentisphaeria bacterium]|nr:M24 family metallopeptidase [Lentisphaeria bacterium]